MSQALYTVSLYETLGPSTTGYIINHASLVCVVTSLIHIPTLLKLKPICPTLRFIISLDSFDSGLERRSFDIPSTLVSDLGIEIYSIHEIEALGAACVPIRYNPPLPSDIVTINFTSGTTADPKGVLLTHRAAVAAASSSLVTIGQDSSDIAFSYLPLAHIFGRLCEQSSFWAGASIGYFHGDVHAIVEDLKLLRPTGFISVPRLYNRFGSAIRHAITQEPGPKGESIRQMVTTRLAQLTCPNQISITNKHSKNEGQATGILASFGLDRARNMVSGSAPLDSALHQYLRAVFGNHFIQGYGLTETYGVCLAQSKGDFTTGNCGGVTPFNEVCLASVPDMGYLVTDTPFPRGELLIRGNTLFSGYLKNAVDTEKALLSDGWFRTGDICSVDARGRFKVIDRIKNILKLAQGEYVSPEKIENVYLSHVPFLTQAYIHGDSLQTFLVGVLGVMPEAFALFAGEILGRHINATDLEAVEAACQELIVKKAVLEELDKVGRDQKLAGFERVRNICLQVEPFTVENELLTPT
jgi:long-chain acyl-CoA synthetase